MNTKGEAAKTLKEQLGLDACIYLGNDLNDITMFSNALDDNDFIVIASHEHKGITEMLINYLKKECEIKGIQWEDAKLLVLEEKNVNNFLHRISKILGVLNSRKKPKGIREKYKVDAVKSSKILNKRNIPYKTKTRTRFYR